MLNKIQMKKKHRRAVYFTIVILLMSIMLPSWFGRKIFDSLWDFTWWLKTKLRVYDYDTD